MPPVQIPMEQPDHTRYEEGWQISFRMDYKALNAQPSRHPRYLTLRCASAYWAVPVVNLDQPKTAFSTTRWHHEMTRMAFGLCNSQATYQRLVNQALQWIGQTYAHVDDRVTHQHSTRIAEPVYWLRRKTMSLC